ncbi:hypothetical protein M5K25_013644 [Dendrobium thyrsiflorum]|uniref:Uncharacterized protein n=1 Tax=Dendrobium thyrsiflorum TaxID=117978 RepID=A0ABD0UU96_DENTH
MVKLEVDSPVQLRPSRAVDDSEEPQLRKMKLNAAAGVEKTLRRRKRQERSGSSDKLVMLALQR